MQEKPSRSRHARSRSRSGSRSASSGRRQSLPRVKSSPRLVRTISADLDISQTLGHLNLDGGPHETIDVPFVKGTLNVTLPLEYLKKDVLNLAQALRVPKWYNKKSNTTHLKPESVSMTKITCALTNAIFKVQYPTLPSLLLRVYGPNVVNLIDRDYELQVIARLSSHNVGPKLYGCFTNGRFEQFLENSRNLLAEEVREWKTSQRIARRMKELHCGVPLLPFEVAQGSCSLQRLDKWIKSISGSKWCKDGKNVRKNLMCKDWPFFLDAVARYRAWLDEAYQDGPHSLVFCHNDAQHGNLLLSSPVVPSAATPVSSAASADTCDSLFPTSSNVSLEQIIRPSNQEKQQDSKLIVIDFEYAGANRAAFDLADHFCEWTCDYNSAEPSKADASIYPNKEELLNFMYSYASHKRQPQQKSIDEEVKDLYNDVIRQRGSVNLHWATWGIIQSGALNEVKKEKAVEEGPGGEKYVITFDSDGEEAGADGDDVTEGVDSDSFDNLDFGRERMAIFWGDMLQLGLVNKEELPDCHDVKYLDITFL
ncbi:LADA_0F01992g1_1 [Lachancea dasiensis]|uniref:LADA_0F01992g1_1 n=1 Tax=Lachancea dasiensis TaxID=1072105 RepID=A0A1G4JIM7_9SACH|nr:LADA_0F01992g1_1 [Lachancea dasiensis]